MPQPEQTPFDVRAYSRSADAFRRAELDLDSFRSRPLAPETLRCLAYLHGIGHHSIRRMRDLLVTPSHTDPVVTAFLTTWAYEEYWLTDALAAVLHAHPGRPTGTTRPRNPATRLRTRVGDRAMPVVNAIVANGIGDRFVAVHMAWGVLDEEVSAALYTRVAELDPHPELQKVGARIRGIKSRHLAFYRAQVHARLTAPGAQLLARRALAWMWTPPGSALRDPAETQYVLGHLLGGRDQRDQCDRVVAIDRSLGSLPGMASVQPLTGSLWRRGRRAGPTTALHRAAPRSGTADTPRAGLRRAR